MSKIKRCCFVDFLVFSLSLSLRTWAIFSSLKLLNLLAAIFAPTKITQFRLQFFSDNGSIICSGLHFWRHFDVNGSIIFGGLHFWCHWINMAKILSKFGEQQLVMVNYACGFNQSETGKYFEWIVNKNILHNNYSMSPSWIWSDKITNKGKWNNCFSKFSNRIFPPIIISTILQSVRKENLAHYFPYDGSQSEFFSQSKS